MADEMTQRQIYDLKRTLEELKKCRGKHTELISLYVPPSKQIFDVVSYLRNEYSQSQNIKSKTTMKNVLSAIESIMSRLKTFNFNCLTSYSDAEMMRDYLYYSHPCVLFDFCKRRYSRHVALLHDYDLYEFTIIVRKYP